LDQASCCFALLCTDCHSFFCFVSVLAWH
jgi:hypothetical protein